MKKIVGSMLVSVLLLTGCQSDGKESSEATVSTATADKVEVQKEQEQKKELASKEVAKKEETKKEEKPVKEKQATQKEVVKVQAKPKVENTVKVVQGEQKKQVEKTNQDFTYTDAKHKFTLQFPAHWKDVKVNHSNWSEDTKASINFTVTIANEEHAISSIIVLDNEETVKNYLSSGIFHELGKANGLTYLYIRPSEAPEKFYTNEYREDLETLRKFVETDVPTVMKTFKLIP
jgi:hypothetical protein